MRRERKVRLAQGVKERRWASLKVFIMWLQFETAGMSQAILRCCPCSIAAFVRQLVIITPTLFTIEIAGLSVFEIR